MAQIVTFEGFDSLLKSFETLDRKVRTFVVKRTLEGVAAPVAQMAEGIARTNSFDTGALADSIRQTKVRADRKRRGRFSVTVGPDFNSEVDYAMFVETGHKIGARKGNVKKKTITDPDTLKKREIVVKDTREVDVPPEPFLRPAMDAHRDEFARLFMEESDKALQDWADKQAAKHGK